MRLLGGKIVSIQRLRYFWPLRYTRRIKIIKDSAKKDKVKGRHLSNKEIFSSGIKKEKHANSETEH